MSIAACPLKEKAFITKIGLVLKAKQGQSLAFAYKASFAPVLHLHDILARDRNRL